MPDPWAVLHLRPDAPAEVASAAHKALVKLLHPDAGNGSSSHMAAVNSAYDAIRGQTRGWRPPDTDDAGRVREENQRLRAENADLRARLSQAATPSAAAIAMPWGKHQGKPLSEIPSDYLAWVTRQDWLDPDLGADIEDVLAWRRTR